jgi:hypothetical protein
MIIQQNDAGNKQKSYKIMKMQMFVTLDKANRGTGNIRGLNLAAVSNTTVQVSRDSSVGIATGYGLDDQGRREFESR